MKKKLAPNSKIESASEIAEFFNFLSDIILIIKKDKSILDLNQAALNYFGCNKEEWIGAPYEGLYTFLSIPPVKLKNTVSTQSIAGIEWQVINSASTNNYILIGKKEEKKIGHLSEISSYEYLQSLLDSDYEGVNIYWKDRKGRILLCNKHQNLSLGFKKDELLGINEYEIAEKKNWAIDYAHKIHRNDQKIINSGHHEIYEEELLIDTQKKFFLSYKSPFLNHKKETIGVFGISVDITTQRIAQEKLKKSKRSTDFYLECILMSCPSNIYWMDRDSRIIGCNDQQAKSFGGNNRLEMIGKNIFDIATMGGATAEMAEKIRQNDLEIMQKRETVTLEEECIVDNELRTFLSQKSPMWNASGEVIGLLGISTDITDRKKMENDLLMAKQRAEELSIAKTRFIANISHDIRTPLAGINGVSDFLLNKIQIEFRKYIRDIFDASSELLNLLNEVLDLAKIESGKFEEIENSFDLKGIIYQLFNLFGLAAKQKNIKLTYFYEKDLPSYFYGNQLFVHRILLNLMGNAVKFTDQGKVTITIEKNKEQSLKLLGNQISLKIQVKDTGIGIPENKQEEIFEDFLRLHPSYKGKYKGSGLGLSIVKQFIQQLKGKIIVKSKVNEGSTFIIYLPLTPLEDHLAEEFRQEMNLLQSLSETSDHEPYPITNEFEQFVSNSADLSSPTAKEGKSAPKILLVEDHPIIQEYTEAILWEEGFEVDIAVTGQEAFNKLIQNEYDLIFMDIGLPDDDGFTVIEKINAVKSLDERVPIIALTAHMDTDQKEYASDIGITDVIIKPLTKKILKEVIEKYLASFFKY